MPSKKRRSNLPLLKHRISREALLTAIQQVRLRLEKQQGEDILHSFVQVLDFQALSTPNTHIIFGRNGVGKTHLLKAYYQFCENDFETNKLLPVYIDFKALQFDPALRSISIEELILRFYKHFVRAIVEHLRVFADKVITVSLLQKVFGGESKKRKDLIESSIDNLDALLNLERIEESLKTYVRTIEKADETTNQLRSKGSILAGISTKKIDAEIGVGVGASTEDIEKEKQKIEIVYGGLAVLDYDAIRSELEKIIELCGADAVNLLIDEWSAVNLSLQPLLAEMIRKTVGISNKIFLKIVALKYFTRTSALIDPPQRIGFQMGIDITELADLDALLSFDINKQGVKDFLTFVAYKHSCLLIPELEKYNAREFEDYLCKEVFENREAYFELVRSSEGNPRDFLTMLSACCSNAKAEAKTGDAKKISLEKVVKAALAYFIDIKAPEINSNPDAQKLFQKIFKCVTSHRQKLFLVSTEKALADNRIKELWHFRFIHLVNPSYEHLGPDHVPHEYSVYSIDYGKLVALKVSEAGETAVKKMISFLDPLLKLVGFRTDTLSNFAQDPKLGGKLKQIAGRALVKEVEIGELKDVQHLIDNCCIDSML